MTVTCADRGGGGCQGNHPLIANSISLNYHYKLKLPKYISDPLPRPANSSTVGPPRPQNFFFWVNAWVIWLSITFLPSQILCIFGDLFTIFKKIRCLILIPRLHDAGNRVYFSGTTEEKHGTCTFGQNTEINEIKLKSGKAMH